MSFSFKHSKIPEPDYETDPPESCSKTGIHEDDGLVYFAGVGNKKNPAVVFVSPCPMEEELDDRYSAPSLLKGGPGTLFKRTALKAGIDLDKQYYTTLCKYCLPANKKLKPSPADRERCKHLFEKELKRRKPSVVVCLGKTVFDYLYQTPFRENEIRGGWFQPPGAHITRSKKWVPNDGDSGGHWEEERFECYRNFRLFVMDPVHMAYSKPEYLEAQIYDLAEVKKQLDQGTADIERVETDYRLLETPGAVREWTEKMFSENRTLFSVDCEWSGEDYLTGDLRSIQFCWEPGSAVMIQFFNEHGEYTGAHDNMGEVASLLQNLLNRENTGFMGHNFYVDALWMRNWLGIETYRKCVFDSMYAMHTVDEYYDLKLERLSIRFTDLGRYDVPLTLWKKQMSGKRKSEKWDDRGYGDVPTEILFPYGCKDVDVPMRSHPVLMRLLAEDETLEYYHSIKLPFVTDSFVHMTEAGMPLNQDDAELVRRNFRVFQDMLLERLKKRIMEEADEWLSGKLSEKSKSSGSMLFSQINPENVHEVCKGYFHREYFDIYEKINHWVASRDFNPNSNVQKARWLFDFKELTPIKSTASDGMPPVSWEKIEAMAPADRKNYSPAVDQETLNIYSETDDLVAMLVEYNTIRKVTEVYLQSRDSGYEQFIRDDGKVHTTFYLTETNRPRSVRPNILNIPKNLKDQIKNGFRRVSGFIDETYGDGDGNFEKAYENFRNTCSEEKKAEIPEKYTEPIPIRWCFRAQSEPEQHCFIEIDFKTAEVFALAYLAGDKKLIEALTQPDPQYVMALRDGVEKPVRVAYDQTITCITDDKCDQDLVTPVEKVEGLVLDGNGNPARPKRDVHWEMAEHRLFMNEPREKLDKAKHRGGGKVGNFSVPYQASGSLLERMVETSIGEKPEPGTGDRLIQAYRETKPRAWEFLEECMRLPGTVGYYKSPSGSKRHFPSLEGHGNISDWKRRSILTPMEREASNVPQQNLVAETLARAITGMVDEIRRENLEIRVVAPLYDAVFLYLPLRMKNRAWELLKKHMSDNNHWDLPGGRLRFGLDYEETLRWSCSPDENEKVLLTRNEQGRQ